MNNLIHKTHISLKKSTKIKQIQNIIQLYDFSMRMQW